MNTDEYYMKKALELARKASGQTSPNPLVGAVVVKNGKIAGKGFHKRAGGPHAEISALRQAGRKAKGARLYVNLEPCNHFGKTPPCTDAVIKSGIKKVVIGMRDPNPVNNGRGIRKFKKNGIKVREGVLKKESQALNQPFTKFITKKIPYVTVKVAQSIDGKIATRSGDSRWISSKESRTLSHRLRSRVDAVLVGINTVLKDNPLLTARFPKPFKNQPKRIIIDSRLKIPNTSKLLKRPQSVIIAATGKAPKKKIEFLKNKGITVIITKENDGAVNLKSLMRHLAKQDIMHILVEGGGRTISSFLKEKLVDEVLFFISPKIIGGKDAVTSVEGKGIEFLREAPIVKDVSVERIGSDILIQGRL